MKIGSIVEYIGAAKIGYYVRGKLVLGVQLKKKQPYTVRDMFEFLGIVNIRLEEVRCPIHPVLKIELCYDIKDFRELLPPMEIQEALDSCEPVLIEINKK